MAKKQRTRNVPDTINIDDLGNASDDELIERFDALERGCASAHDDDAVLWETELAYVVREQIIRTQRRDAHAAFLKQCDNRPEHMLPEPDMDNSAYVNVYMERLERWGIA